MADTSLQDMSDVRDRIKGIRAVMITTPDETGRLSSRPMTVQQVADDGDVWFLAGRSTDWVPATTDKANVAFTDDDTWISFAGTLEKVDDAAVVEGLWDPMTDSWFPDGKAEAVALHLHTDQVQWWTGAGKLRTLIEVVKTKAGSSSRPDAGDSGTIEA